VILVFIVIVIAEHFIRLHQEQNSFGLFIRALFI